MDRPRPEKFWDLQGCERRAARSMGACVGRAGFRGDPELLAIQIAEKTDASITWGANQKRPIQ